jgi:hypothetical protein
VVIKPLVGQHAPEKENSEGGMSLNWALIFARQFDVEFVVLLSQVWTK